MYNKVPKYVCKYLPKMAEMCKKYVKYLATFLKQFLGPGSVFKHPNRNLRPFGRNSSALPQYNMYRNHVMRNSCVFCTTSSVARSGDAFPQTAELGKQVLPAD